MQVEHIKLNYEKWRFLLWIELIVKIGFEQQNWDHIFNYIVRSFAQGARQIGTRVREMVVDLWYVPQLRDNTFRYWFIANSSMDYRCYPKKKKKKKKQWHWETFFFLDWYSILGNWLRIVKFTCCLYECSTIHRMDQSTVGNLWGVIKKFNMFYKFLSSLFLFIY